MAEIAQTAFYPAPQLLQAIGDAQRVGKMESIRVQTRTEAQPLQGIKRVILVGSSGVGKSTLQQAVLRASRLDPDFVDKISVPSRVITRSPRPDDGEEITYATPEGFTQMEREGKLGLFGTKKMEGGREEKYGYTLPEPNTLPIFFANNGVLKNAESVGPSGIFDDALVLVIYTPDSIRRSRVLGRSPQLAINKPEEFAFRFSPEERSSRLIFKAHATIKNFGVYEAQSARDVLELLKLIVTEDTYV